MKTLVPKGRDFVELIDSLRREEKLSTWEQFAKRLELISTRIGKNGRAVFIVDPLEYIDENCAEDWALLVGDLPAKIKFVFAQRSEDALARYRKFCRLGNVVRIPKDDLGPLDDAAIEDLLEKRVGRLSLSINEVRNAVVRYGGHPYATVGALDLIEDGTSIENLPSDPTDKGIVEEQWEKICQRGEEAIRLFKAYAILEVSVPDDIVDGVADIGANARLKLLADNPYLDKLLYREGESRCIYHLLLAKYILDQIGKEEKQKYHGRAVRVYRGKLSAAKKAKSKPDGLAAVRLPEHILEAEGPEAFVDAFVNECYGPLDMLGLLDAALSFSQRALGMVKKGSEERAVVLGNLGLIYGTRGELDKAEEMHKKSLEIDEKMGNKEGMASDYGNLGLIYMDKGELDKAEQMFRDGLKIDEKLGRLEGMAAKYGNLGLIYMDKGELDKAEEMHKRSLEIAEEIGHQEIMASDYGNLGLIYYTRGELDKAEEMHLKSLEIEKKLGRQEGMASDYGNLGLIYQTRGELDKAEEMHKKSLEIDEKMGNKEGMASDYGNLGLIYEERGDIKKTLEYWEKAVDLYKRIGMPHMVKKVQGWIDGVRDDRGQTTEDGEFLN